MAAEIKSRNGLWGAIQPKESAEFDGFRNRNELEAVRIAVYQILVTDQMRCLMRVIRRIMAVVVARTLLFEISIVVTVTVIACG